MASDGSIEKLKNLMESYRERDLRHLRREDLVEMLTEARESGVGKAVVDDLSHIVAVQSEKLIDRVRGLVRAEVARRVESAAQERRDDLSHLIERTVVFIEERFGSGGAAAHSHPDTKTPKKRTQASGASSEKVITVAAKKPAPAKKAAAKKQGATKSAAAKSTGGSTRSSSNGTKSSSAD